MAEDVWKAGSAGDPDAPIDLGEVDFESAMPADRAFSLPVVFSNGIAAWRENTVLVMVLGFAMWIPEGLTGVVSSIILTPLSTIEPDDLVGRDPMELLAEFGVLYLAVMAVSIVFGVIGIFLRGGAITTAANFISNDTVSYPHLVTSFMPGLKLLGYRVIIGLISGLAFAVVYAAAIGCIAGAAAGGDPSFIVAAICAIVVIFLVAFAGLVWFSLKVQIGSYATVLDMGPIAALGTAWSHSTNPVLVALFVIDLLYGLSLVAILVLQACFGVIPYVGSYIGIAVAAVPQSALYGLFCVGMSASYLLASRSQDETRKIAFFERNPVHD
jgi:hypothetical protein